MNIPRLKCWSTALRSLLATSLFAFSGCASSNIPALKLTSIDHHQTFRQEFVQGYARRDSTGNIDVVLLDAAEKQSLDSGKAGSPVRQVMHIRVLWTPSREMKAVATNASIKWYVIGDARPQDVLAYTGSGFVSYNESDSDVTLTISNALLKPSEGHGTLSDPVGTSRLEGTVVAHTDDTQVRKVLGNLQVSLTAAADATARAAADDRDKPIDH